MLFEVKRVIVGQERVVERLLIGLLARGHCLLEGVPGVAKTLAVETLARTVSGSFSRLQFTPDLVPSDIVGTRIYRPGSERFDTELGPIMANFVLADEINRAPAKVQSALLEVMAERQVSIGGQRYPVPSPFLVLATQNPIESEGVYPLPEAQRDRFLMKINVDYPSPAEEREIVYRMGVEPPVASAVITHRRAGPAAGRRPAGSSSTTRSSTTSCGSSWRPGSPAQHGLTDVEQWVAYGASPRASLGLIAAGRAMALLRGRDYVLPQDVLDIAIDVLSHRMVLSYDAIADGVAAEQAVRRVLQTIPLPQVAPRQRSAPATRRSPASRPVRPAARVSRRQPASYRPRRSRRTPAAGRRQPGRPAPAGRGSRLGDPPLGRGDARAGARRARPAPTGLRRPGGRRAAAAPPRAVGAAPARRAAAGQLPRPGARARAPRRASRGPTCPATTCGAWTGR